jgi:tetratricopeptide (TPR) repeat protein
MAIISDKELSQTAQSLWQKAQQADKIGNHGYVIQLIRNILKESPGFLEGRKLSRRAAIAVTKGKKSSALTSTFSKVALSGQSTLKKDPLLAMEMAEQQLEGDPTNVNANQLLKDAANRAGFPEIAAFAIETAVAGSPNDKKVLHELGAQYRLMGEADKAVKVYERIVGLDPSDLEAIKMSKDASAASTIARGGWEQSGSYLDKMKNKDEAIALQGKDRQAMTVEMVDSQFADLYPAWEQNQQAVDTTRRIAELMARRFDLTSADEDFSNTIQWFEYLNGLTGGNDPAIARRLSDFQAKIKERRISELEKWFSEGGDEHPDAATYRDELKQLKKDVSANTIAEARRRVERNPTDLQLRFELGEALFNISEIEEAIPELQRARQSPNARLRALKLLGQCFIQKGMLDMAVGQLETVTKELTTMDNLKKDSLYELGLLHERMGKREEYIACIKEIAEVDYTYKDVSKRIERFYSGQ